MQGKAGRRNKALATRGRTNLRNPAQPPIASFGSLGLERRVSTHRKQYHLQELTITKGRIGQRKRGCSVLLYIVMELSAALRILRSPKLVENIGRAQSLRPCLFKPAPLVPYYGLLLRRMTQV